MANQILRLPPDIIPLISSRLLSDPIDLISFRAVCRLFRYFSPNPRSLSSPFRPRQWIMLSDGDGDLTVPRSFLNLCSSRCIEIDLPELYGHDIISSVDGLLVLLHKESLIVRLFNPFTRLMVNLPPFPLKLLANFTRGRYYLFESVPTPLVSVAISSSDESDNPNNPTVIISLEKYHRTLVSMPGDRKWVVFKRWHNFQYNVLFFQGRFYATNQEGTVCSINPNQAQQQQEEQEEGEPTELVSPDWEPGQDRVHRSYLVESNSTLLLVRKYSAPRPNGAFAEVYQIHPETNTVCLVGNIGNRALFVGPTRTLSVSSKDFPCVKDNSIYFGTELLTGPVVIYKLEDHACEPISDHAVIHNGVRKLRPSVRPLTLADHLITYCSHTQWAKGLMYHEFCVFPRGWKEDDFIWGITTGTTHTAHTVTKPSAFTLTDKTIQNSITYYKKQRKQSSKATLQMEKKQLPTFLLFLFLSLHRPAQADGPIKNVVILVMENRSFDHMLGWMKKLNPEINGVTGSEWNPISASDPNSDKVYFTDQAHFVDPDPGHSFQAIREQIFGSNDSSSQPLMNGFVQQARSMSGNMTEAVMNGFGPDKVAVYKELVQEFAVFDRWFASVPSSTQPNRMFVHSATSGGATSNDAGKLAMGFPQRTIFDNIHDNGHSFGIYYQDVPAVLFYRNLRKVKYVTKFHSYSSTFKNHARKGSLPNYAVIEQHYLDSKSHPADDDHPSHDVYQGQMFIKEVYETLRASPQWNESLLVITYDEHGGFFDHVPTPVNGVPSPDGIVGPDPFYFKFDRLGVRVPTIMVSPWIEKGTVVHGPNGSPTATSEYEHSSIPATVKKIFDLPSPFLTRRDEWAGTFEGILKTRTEPRTDCPVQLPMPIKIRESEANEEAKLSEFQQELVQLASVLNGDHQLKGFQERIENEMVVREGIDYIQSSVKRFFEAGASARRMGVNEEHIVKMRPSLTTRVSLTAGNP
ncbi:hypothetical protein LUZ60_003676 [Juncus effusus]|nr:hypothetical protein LUZ60_003676 [Juncus effusus]